MRQWGTKCVATVTYFVTGMGCTMRFNKPTFCYLVKAFYYRVTKCVGGNTMDRSRGEIAVAGNIYKRTPTEKTVFVYFFFVSCTSVSLV